MLMNVVQMNWYGGHVDLSPVIHVSMFGYLFFMKLKQKILQVQI